MVEETKKGLHRGWLVFVGCCFLAASSMALTVSILGVYLVPAATRLGVNPGDFAMWGTVSGFVSVVVMPFWGNLMPKYTKACFTAGSCLLICALLIFAFAPNNFVSILGGVCVGAQMPMMFTVGIPSIMGQWFVGNQRGKFLGIATAFSGFGTFVWAPLFTYIIQTVGVQTSYIINAIIAAVFTLPWALFVFKWNPEDCGLKPIGWTPEAEAEAKAAAAAVNTEVGVPHTKALKTPAFWIIFIAVLMGSIGMGFNSAQPAMAQEFLAGDMDANAAAMLGASMISAAAAGNIVSKLISGFINDKFGAVATIVVYQILVIIAAFIWLFLQNTAAYLVAGFLFGFVNAVSSVGLPLVVRTIFGNKDYSKIWSYQCMGSALVGGSATATVAYVAQAAGTYMATCWLCIAMQIVVIFFVVISAKMGKNYVEKYGE